MAFEPIVKGKRVHGSASPGEFLTKDMDFFKLRTTLDISLAGVESPTDDPETTPTDFPGVNSQERLNKLIETINLRAQPVLISDINETTETAPVADLPITNVDYSSGDSVTVYNISFAIEHKGAWPSAEDLLRALDGIAPRNNDGTLADAFVWDDVDPSQNNVTVSINDFL